MTTHEFIATYHITMTSDYADRNPYMPTLTKHDQEWSHHASHYKCTFRLNRKRLTTYFSMGMAHTHAPTAAEVLECLASDSATVENARDFEDFAADLGYDSDSRTAEHLYQTIQRQAEKLERFLGADRYHTLLWEIDRD